MELLSSLQKQALQDSLAFDWPLLQLLGLERLRPFALKVWEVSETPPGPAASLCWLGFPSTSVLNPLSASTIPFALAQVILLNCSANCSKAAKQWATLLFFEAWPANQLFNRFCFCCFVDASVSPPLCSPPIFILFQAQFTFLQLDKKGPLTLFQEALFRPFCLFDWLVLGF